MINRQLEGHQPRKGCRKGVCKGCRKGVKLCNCIFKKSLRISCQSCSVASKLKEGAYRHVIFADRVRQLAQKCREHGDSMVAPFVDLSKAYIIRCPGQLYIWKVWNELGFHHIYMLSIIRSIHCGMKAEVRLATPTPKKYQC